MQFTQDELATIAILVGNRKVEVQEHIAKTEYVSPIIEMADSNYAEFLAEIERKAYTALH